MHRCHERTYSRYLARIIQQMMKMVNGKPQLASRLPVWRLSLEIVEHLSTDIPYVA